MGASLAVAIVLFGTADAGQTPPAAQPSGDYDRAVAHRLAGRNALAIEGLERVLAAAPGNLDARLNLGLALLAEGRLDEAEAAFDAVLADAPSYADARLGLARVAQRRGDLSGARRMLDAAEASGPTDASEVVALRRSLNPVARGHWRVVVAGSTSRLSDDLPEWRSTSLAVSRRVGLDRTLSVSVEATERFGLDDLYVEGRLDQRVGRTDLHLALGGAREGLYRPEAAASVGVRHPIAGVTAILDVGVARYQAGTVAAARPGVVVPLGPRVGLTAQWIGVRDENGDVRDGFSLKAAVEASPGLRLHAAHVDAPEASDGRTVDVVATSLGLAVDLSPTITVFLDGVHEDRDAYRRDELSMAVGWRF